MKTELCTVALLLGALLACKSKHGVNGTITVNGAPFTAEQCNVAEVKMDMGGGAASVTRSVTLVDAAKRRLSFSDADGVAVSFSDGHDFPLNAGRGCGSIHFSGPVSDPGALKVTLDLDCRGGGIETQAMAEITGCGSYGPKLLP